MRSHFPRTHRRTANTNTPGGFAGTLITTGTLCLALGLALRAERSSRAALAVLLSAVASAPTIVFFNRWTWREDSETSLNEHILIMNSPPFLHCSSEKPWNQSKESTIPALIAEPPSTPSPPTLTNPPLIPQPLRFPALHSRFQPCWFLFLSERRWSCSCAFHGWLSFRLLTEVRYGLLRLVAIVRHRSWQPNEMLHMMLWGKLWTNSKKKKKKAAHRKRRNICIIARIKTVRLFFLRLPPASLRFAGMKRKTRSHPRCRKCFRRHKEVSGGKRKYWNFSNLRVRKAKSKSISVHVTSCVARKKKKQKS